MANPFDESPSFETTDLIGTTDSFMGSVSGSWLALPSVSGAIISEFIAICSTDQSPPSPHSKRLLVSLDGGTTYVILAPGDSWSWPVRDERTQIHIKGNVSGGVNYEVVLNREDPV